MILLLENQASQSLFIRCFLNPSYEEEVKTIKTVMKIKTLHEGCYIFEGYVSNLSQILHVIDIIQHVLL